MPNTPHITPQSSVSGPPPPDNTDTDPLIEPLPAVPVSAAGPDQASSAPVTAPRLSVPVISHQAVSAPPPQLRRSVLMTSPLDWSREEKKERQLQRYEHLIDPDGDKIVVFESLYNAARLDVANTEFQIWLLYKQQAVGTEAEAFERILKKKIPKNVQLRKRKRKDHLPLDKDRHDLTSQPKYSQA